MFSYHLFVNILFITYIKHKYSSISKIFNFLGNTFNVVSLGQIIKGQRYEKKFRECFTSSCQIGTTRESFNVWIGKFSIEGKKHLMYLKIFTGPLEK